MSGINEMIAEYCPDGVLFRPLGELGDFTRGGGPQKKDFVDAGVGCIHYGQIYTYYGVSTEKTKAFVSSDVASKSRQASPGDVIIAVTSENDEDLGKAVAWLGTSDIAVSNHTLIYSGSLDPKYLSYFLLSASFQNQKRKYVNGTKVRSISRDALSKIRIPVPPLEVQREIVRVLDLFTSLEAELEARRKQYEHYRDHLLTFDQGGVTWRAVGEIGFLFGGLVGKSREDFVGGNARFVTYKNIYDNQAVDLNNLASVAIRGDEKQRRLEEGDILLTGSSEGRNDAAMSSVLLSTPVEDVYLNSFSIGYRLFEREMLLPGFAKHLFRSNTMRRQLVKCVNGVTRFNVSKRSLEKVQVPVPEPSFQHYIAEKLDEMFSLTTSLESGLPAEIKARRKQYEYYRDKLLTFKEKVA